MRVIPLGPFERLDFAGLIWDLNHIQGVYDFQLDDPLHNLPAPTERAANWRNVSPQYAPVTLFSYMNSHRPSPEHIRVGTIDAEVYHDLYSAVDAESSMLIVSGRVSGLPQVLAASRKTLQQFVALDEIGAQLLCIQYRRRVGLSADPGECAKPWHIERRNCLFDYYGLAEQNVTKLASPRISDVVAADFTEAEVPERYISASMTIVRGANLVDKGRRWGGDRR